MQKVIDLFTLIIFFCLFEIAAYGLVHGFRSIILLDRTFFLFLSLIIHKYIFSPQQQRVAFRLLRRSTYQELLCES